MALPCLNSSMSPPRAAPVGQDRAAVFARAHFGKAMPHIERLMPLFANTGIRSRQLCQPPEWYEAEHGLDDKNAAYIEAATSLCAGAARELLQRRGLSPADINRIYYINTTGLATPSIDARLINILGLSRQVRRTPIWGLGCAGGVSGLATAANDLVGRPRERALVFAAEMCTLTFLAGDFSKSNLVALALFADAPPWRCCPATRPATRVSHSGDAIDAVPRFAGRHGLERRLPRTAGRFRPAYSRHHPRARRG
jgi:alkylresorcinol/alkylpyrone synthase